MLFSSLLSNPLNAIIFVILLLVTIGVHEFAHAKVADELGDPTPRLMGRVTLNPVAHIDPLGLLLLFLVGFGWGKPVLFDPFNLKDPRRDAALISLAGPASNFAMAILAALIFRVSGGAGLVELIIPPFIYLNILLGIFNLLPISPLDGFKIVGGFLPESQAREWYQLERYGLIFLLFLILPLMGSRSMLELFVSPIIRFFYSLLLP